MRSTHKASSRTDCIHCNQPILSDTDRKFKSGKPLNQHTKCFNARHREYAKAYRLANREKIKDHQNTRNQANSTFVPKSRALANKRDRAEDGKYLPKLPKVFNHSNDKDLIAKYLETNTITKHRHSDPVYEPSTMRVASTSSISYDYYGRRVYKHLDSLVFNTIDETVLEY